MSFALPMFFLEAMLTENSFSCVVHFFVHVKVEISLDTIQQMARLSASLLRCSGIPPVRDGRAGRGFTVLRERACLFLDGGELKNANRC